MLTAILFTVGIIVSALAWRRYLAFLHDRQIIEQRLSEIAHGDCFPHPVFHSSTIGTGAQQDHAR